jgi:hypothetical protein
MTSMDEGTKFDGIKLPWDLFPWIGAEEIVRVLQFGANKYAPRNWEKGIKYSRIFGAVMRHMIAWFLGETNDKETGLNHLAHAGCEILFVLTYSMRGMDAFDDRPTKDYLAAARSESEQIFWSSQKVLWGVFKMGYSLKILPKHLILNRNGKLAGVFYKKFKDNQMYEWLRRRIPTSRKKIIDEMLLLVGIRQEVRKHRDKRTVPIKISRTA